MRLHIWAKTSVVILSFLLPQLAFSAMYTKTVTMPPSATVMSTGTPNLAAGILEVGMQGVEFIPSAASESRAVATLSKGLRVPTSGIISSLKTGLKANIPGLLTSAAVAGIVAGVDWIQGEGGQIQKPTTGGPVSTNPSDGDYYWTSFNANGATFSSADETCEFFSRGGRNSVSLTLTSPIAGTCSITYQEGDKSSVQVYRSGSHCPAGSTYNDSKGACTSAVTYAPLTDSDYDVLDGFIKDQNGVWQRGLANEVCKNASNYEGCIVGMGATPYISGPAVVSSPDVTTQTQSQNADGTTTDVTTKTHTDYSLGYPSSSPGTISIDPKTSTTTTTTTKDAAGNTVSTGTKTDTSSSTQPGSGTAISDGTFTDTPFPDVGPFYTQKYKDGFKGVWDKNKQSLMQSDFIQFLEGFVPSFSGTCPTFGLSFAIMAHANYGYVPFWSMCWIFDIIKTIMLVTAMFTCRALIFGG